VEVETPGDPALAAELRVGCVLPPFAEPCRLATLADEPPAAFAWLEAARIDADAVLSAVELWSPLFG